MELSGAVEGTAEWPSHLEPVAWHNGGDMVRMKLGLYHSTNNVADGEVSQQFNVRPTTVISWLPLQLFMGNGVLVRT